nr:HAD domain-containing protein [Dechloromonas denitrificans]
MYEALSIKIVLSTSWGRALGHRQALAWLPGWLQSRVVGGCWHRRYAAEDGWLHVWHTFSRYEQVRHYVIRRSVQDWLALDNDDDGWPDDERHRLVKTDDMKGLAEEGKAEELRVRLVALEAAYQARTGRGPAG